jgi:hypothetical protein
MKPASTSVLSSPDTPVEFSGSFWPDGAADNEGDRMNARHVPDHEDTNKGNPAPVCASDESGKG